MSLLCFFAEFQRIFAAPELLACHLAGLRTQFINYDRLFFRWQGSVLAQKSLRASTFVVRLLTLLWVSYPIIGNAQSTLPDPSSELQRQDRQRSELRLQQESQPWLPSSGIAQTPSRQKIPDEQPCVLINSIDIKGDPAYQGLHTSLSGVQADDPPLGRCLGSQGITLLVQRLQQLLVEQGYITSHVHVPEQDLSSGTLILQIDAGRVARIRSAQADQLLPHLAWATGPGDLMNLRDIEQSSENLQRLPSLGSKIQIEPGEVSGTSDVVVDLQARRPLRLGVSADDGGNRATGKLQGNLTLSWDNPLGLSDLFYFTKGQDLGGKDNGPRGSQNQIIHYSVPWGYWLLGATSSENRYHQTVYGPYESYLYRGNSSQQEISLQRVLFRNSSSKTTATIKEFLRQSNNFIADQEVLVQRRRTAGWEFVLQHLYYFEAGTFNANVVYRRGTGAFGAKPAPEEAMEEGTGRMQLTTGLLHWSMPLKIAGQTWNYNTQLQWQASQTRLTPQDMFCLGSRATVRGFDGQKTLCGDRGQLWRQELAAALPLIVSAQAYIAFDTGRTTTPGQGSAYRLSGMVVGLRGQHNLADYPLQWEAFVGRPLTRPEGFSTTHHVAGFSVRAEF